MAGKIPCLKTICTLGFGNAGSLKVNVTNE